MNFLGFEIRRTKAAPAASAVPVRPPAWPNWLSFWPVREPYTGAWQQNMVLDPGPNILAFSAVYCCVTGIANDVAKMRVKLVQEDADGIWNEVRTNSPFLPVLNRPNHYQNRIQFFENWIVSKLLAGNTYALKRRDNRGVVTALYLLDPRRVKILITDDGGVYYQLGADDLANVEDTVVVPASEIIHDLMTPLFHRLVGVPPIFACALSASMGNNIQSSATHLFGNRALPGGVVAVPGHITQEQADRLKVKFEEWFSGPNIGRIAVLSDGMTFEPTIMTAEAAQQVEQLRWTVEDVGRAFHYPAYKLGGPVPPYSAGPEVLTLMYYTDCLQILIESLELALDEGLGLLSAGYGAEMDLDNLLRMDSKSLFESNNQGISGGWMKPDEARFRANLAPVPGGATPYLQQQNYSLAALAKRDALANPFEPKTPRPAPAPAPSAEEARAFPLALARQLDAYEPAALAEP
jgi:HK97 family phage portal protein